MESCAGIKLSTSKRNLHEIGNSEIAILPLIICKNQNRAYKN
jgi:hypothetical protein